MVIGDAIVDIDSMLTGTTLDFQPAAGVEVVITQGSSDDGTALVTLLDQTDGTSAAHIADLSITGNANHVVKLFVNNTVFLRRVNTAVGTQILGFSGIQTNV